MRFGRKGFRSETGIAGTGTSPAGGRFTGASLLPWLPAHVREMRLYPPLARLALPVVALFSLAMAAAAVYVPPEWNGHAGSGLVEPASIPHPGPAEGGEPENDPRPA